MSISIERRREVKERARYFCAGLVENAEPMASGHFDDLSDEEQELLQKECEAIGKRIYKEPRP